MKISVIIPVYNKSKYLDSTLHQIRNQRFSDYECLLIDDGSTDGSGEICDKYTALDSRFRVFHIPNGGVSHARNVGLDAARGEYITFIDSDDGVQESYLENLWRGASESGADLVISGFEKVSADGTVLKKVIPKNQGTMSFQDLLHNFAAEQLETGIFGYCFSKTFSRRMVERIRFDESLKLAEDFDFYLNLYEIIETVHFDDHAYYQYLQDAENSTGNTASEKIDYLAQLRINIHYREVLKKRSAYQGENREILEQRLSNYAFFVLFHTPMPYYRERFDTLHETCRIQQITLHSDKILGKWLFWCLQHRLYFAAKMTMRLYRMAREVRKVLR